MNHTEYFIRKCFYAHHFDLVTTEPGWELYFTFEEYRDFWLQHHVGDRYQLKNRNGSSEICKIAYYPLPYYKDLRALIEINKITGTDFREVPVKFLEKIV